MKELLEYLARGLVEKPDEVRVVEVKEDDKTTVLELSVADDDYGSSDDSSYGSSDDSSYDSSYGGYYDDRGDDDHHGDRHGGPGRH